MDHFFPGLVMGAAAMFALLMALTGDSVFHGREVIQVIAQCEAELPRNQTCRAVITAEVVEIKDEL